MGRIFKSIFILRYLDEKPLRQGIEKQLNRIEQSHQFAKAIFFGNNQEFKVETKEEQEIAVGCRHLIQNAIVLWNYLFISEKLSEIIEQEEHKKLLNSFSNSSIMTWQHINLHGEYDFEIAKPTTSFDLEKNPIDGSEYGLNLPNEHFLPFFRRGQNYLDQIPKSSNKRGPN